MLIRYFTFILTFLLMSTADAAPGNPDNWCRNGLFPQEGPNFRIGKIVGEKNERVYFLNDFEKCPEEGGSKCQQKSYLIPGDQFLAARPFKNWVCGQYLHPAKGKILERTGWLPIQKTQLQTPETNPHISQWIGHWSDGSRSIKISEGKNNTLKINGNASWDGGQGNIHVGEVSGESKQNGNQLVVANPNQDDCVLNLMLVNTYLVATDNGQCGGANVRFDGVYLKGN